MRYRKIPVEVDAWKLSSVAKRPEWAAKVNLVKGVDGKYVTHAYIDTLEGVMRAELGDYIVRGVNGELYPVKPDIFRKTYERVEEENTPMPRDDTI